MSPRVYTTRQEKGCTYTYGFRMPTVLMKRVQILKSGISKKQGVPLHHQLFMVLKDQILRGLYEPGAKIPNEEQLGELFNVSRITVRRAISDLHDQGLVIKRHGHGTFVGENIPAARPAATLNFIDLLRRQAHDTQVKVLSISIERPPALIALNLQLPSDRMTMHLVRLRFAEGVPVMLIDAWLPEEIGDGLNATNLCEKALHEILLERGVIFSRVVQEINAVSADPELANWLRVDVGSPLLQLTRLLYGADRRPLAYTTIHVSSDRSRFLMDIPVEVMNTFNAGQIAHDAHNVHLT